MRRAARSCAAWIAALSCFGTAAVQPRAQTGMPRVFNELVAEKDQPPHPDCVLQLPATNPDPIDLATGAFRFAERDATLPGLNGLDLRIARSYDSGVSYDGPFGQRWDSPLFARIYGPSGGDALVHTGHGRMDVFTFQSSSGTNAVYASPSGLFYKLTKRLETGSWSFHLVDVHGVDYVFESTESAAPDALYRLAHVMDPHGNKVRFVYDSLDYLRQIVDTANRVTTVSYYTSGPNSGRVQSITDGSQRTFQYVFDSSGDLTAVVRPATAQFPSGTSDTYTYTSAGGSSSLLESAQQAGKAGPYLFNTYDAQARVVTQQFGEPGDVTTIDYSTYAVDSTVKVTDSVGYVVDYTFDALHQLTRRVVHDSAVPTTTYALDLAYDAQGNVVSRVLADGSILERTYDSTNADPRARSNVLQVRHLAASGDPNPRVWKYTYTAAHNRIATAMTALHTAATGGQYVASHATRYTYTTRGKLKKVQFPDVTTPNGTQLIDIEFEYDNQGRMTKRVTPNGTETWYTYDATALCPFPASEIQDALGEQVETDYTYDAAFRVTSIEADCACAGGGRRREFDYDARGGLVEKRVTVDATRTYVEQYVRDEVGDAKQVRRSSDSIVGDGWYVEDFVFDRLGNPLVVAQDVSTTERIFTSFEYDGRQRLTRLTNANGNAIEYEYDDSDALTVERALGALASPADDIERRYTYDEMGRLSSETTPSSATTTYTYDAYGGLDFITAPSGATLRVGRDLDGRVLNTRVYDSNGVLADQVEHEYDEHNRRTLTRRRYVDSSGAALGGGYLTEHFEYDIESNLTKHVLATGAEITHEYDALGHLLHTRDSLLPANGWDYTYDADGSLATLHAVEGNQATGVSAARLVAHYTQLDAVGRPLAILDGAGKANTYEWSVDGRLVATVDRSGRRTEYTHDELGRTLSATRKITPLASGTPADIVRQYAYSGVRLASLSATNAGYGAAQTTSYGYDAFGRRTTTTFANGTQQVVAFDADSRVASLTDPLSNTRTYMYDADGSFTGFSVSNPAGVVGESYVHCVVDDLGRLVSAENDDYTVTRAHNSIDGLEREQVVAKDGSSSTLVRVQYDAYGRPHALLYPSDQPGSEDRTLYSWDGVDRLQSVEKQNGAAVRTIAQYSYDGARVLAETGPQRSTQLGYDALGRITSIDHSTPTRDVGEFALRYNDRGELTDNYRKYFNAQGAELPLTSSSGGIHYEYDQGGAVAATYSGLTKTALDAGNFNQALYTRTYDYDRVWNRRTVKTKVGAITTVVSVVANVINEFLSVNFIANAHDANGNVTSVGNAPSMTFDHRNHPIVLQQAAATLALRYDPFGRRIDTRTADGAKRETIAYWGWQALTRSANEGATTAASEFNYGAGIDDVLERSDLATGVVAQLFTNESGSLVAAVEPGAGMTHAYRYRDFGRRQRVDPQTGAELADPSPSMLTQPIGFQGRWTVAGNEKLYDFRNRVYLPDWGRFAQRDPLGYANRILNRYQLGGNDPNERDPYGLAYNEPGEMPESESDEDMTATSRDETHVGQTIAAAQAAGMGNHDAFMVAEWNWYQDHSENEAGLFSSNNARYHALGSEEVRRDRLSKLERMNSSTCSLQRLGWLLHFAQDDIYHRDRNGKPFGEKWGHMFASSHCLECGSGGVGKAIGVGMGWLANPLGIGVDGCPDHGDQTNIEFILRDFRSRTRSEAYIREWMGRCGDSGDGMWFPENYNGLDYEKRGTQPHTPGAPGGRGPQPSTPGKPAKPGDNAGKDTYAPGGASGGQSPNDPPAPGPKGAQPDAPKPPPLPELPSPPAPAVTPPAAPEDPAPQKPSTDADGFFGPDKGRRSLGAGSCALPKPKH